MVLFGKVLKVGSDDKLNEELVKYIQGKIDYLYKSLERQHDNGYKNWARGNLKAYEDMLFQLIKLNNKYIEDPEDDLSGIFLQNRRTSGLFETGYYK